MKELLGVLSCAGAVIGMFVGIFFPAWLWLGGISLIGEIIYLFFTKD